MNCIFCKIIAGEIPSKKAYEDDKVLAFYDIDPQAPTHILIIPKRHCDSVMDADDDTMAYMIKIAKQLAIREGIAENGFRLVVNTGADGGQSVMHLHLHLLGGRRFNWPAG